MKSYEDLTPEEKSIICNGCGVKGWLIRPPYAVFFETNCNKHDFSYYIGCTEADRLKADNGLRRAMAKDCKNLPLWEYLKYKPWCYLYYIFIRLFGGRYFYYADKQREV